MRCIAFTVGFCAFGLVACQTPAPNSSDLGGGITSGLAAHSTAAFATTDNDGLDYNCDGPLDDIPWVDADHDFHYSLASCVPWSRDCDDTNPNVFDDCTSCVDMDGDGYFVGCDAYATVQFDCDDTRADVNPAAIEVCDGIDNNCNGLIDEGLVNPELVLSSGQTLDCSSGNSPFSTVAAWDEPVVRIADGASDVAIRNCVLSNRLGAITLGA